MPPRIPLSKATPRSIPTSAKPPRFPYFVVLAGTGFFFTLSYVGSSYYIAIQKPLPSREESESLDLSTIWKNKAALKYDGELESTEYWGGILKRRREMMKLAEGHVLESAVGTGRNSGFYNREKVKSLTMVDQSKKMLEVCRHKWENPEKGDSLIAKVPARFLVGDLGRDEVGKMLRPEEENTINAGTDGKEARKFDTVVETMGLCSCPDPVKLLQNLARVVKKDGKILLLEHGKSHYEWLDKLLDHTAIDHAKEHGCWWNRDIGAIVEKSGLKVDEIKRYSFGTLWWIVLRAPDKLPEEAPAKIVSQAAEKSSWQFWK